MKRLIIFLVASAIITSVLLCGCNSDKATNNATSQATTEAVTDSVSATESTTFTSTQANATEVITEVQTEKSTALQTEASTEEKIIDIDEIAHENYEFVDETVTNPTVTLKEDNSTIDSSKTENLAGDWNVLEVVTVADSKILSTKEAFGSAYSNDSFLLKIADDNSFTLNLGNETKKGTYTVSGNNLIVTYDNNEPDTFLYISKFENKETIKVQFRDLYIYFAR